MVRLLFWVAAYVLFIGVISFEVTHRDGLKIKLTGWPELLARRRAKKEEG